MSIKLKMTVDDALEFADEWIRGHTIHENSQGWRIVCWVLAEEVRRLRNQDLRASSSDLSADPEVDPNQ